MNTLSKKITPLFFEKEAQSNCHNEVRQLWKELQSNSKEHPLTLAHHILYAILRGKDWRKNFTPITNKVKLANGAKADGALLEAQYRLNARTDVFKDFEPLINPTNCALLVRSMLQDRKDDAYNSNVVEKLVEKTLI